MIKLTQLSIDTSFMREQPPCKILKGRWAAVSLSALAGVDKKYKEEEAERKGSVIRERFTHVSREDEIQLILWKFSLLVCESL